MAGPRNIALPLLGCHLTVRIIGVRAIDACCAHAARHETRCVRVNILAINPAPTQITSARNATIRENSRMRRCARRVCISGARFRPLHSRGIVSLCCFVPPTPRRPRSTSARISAQGVGVGRTKPKMLMCAQCSYVVSPLVLTSWSDLFTPCVGGTTNLHV